MKPLRLTIEGINSFTDRQEIDFEPLCRYGIFGIFGRTGSGKSTILDCIMLALYGSMSKKRERLDFVNQGRTQAAISFSFLMNERGTVREYLIEREFRIRKSGADTQARLYERRNGELYSLAENAKQVNEKLLSIIGIEQDDFKKCIALPQGEFASLLSATPKEQTEIIGKLFSLERFGETLTRRINGKLKDVKAESERLEREMESLGDVSAAFGETLKTKLKELDEAAEELSNALAEKSAKLLSLTQRLEKSRKLQSAEQELSSMAEREAEIRDEEQRLERYLSALPLFPLLEAEERAAKAARDARAALSLAERTHETALAESGAVTRAYPDKNRELNDALQKITLRCGRLSALSERAGKYEAWKQTIEQTRREYRAATEADARLLNAEKELEIRLKSRNDERQTLSGECERLAEALKRLGERTLAAGERSAYRKMDARLEGDGERYPGLNEYIAELRGFVREQLSALEALSPAGEGELKRAQEEHARALKALSDCEKAIAELRVSGEKLASERQLTAAKAENLLRDGKALKDQREELERAFADAGIGDPSNYRDECTRTERERTSLEAGIAALEQERRQAEETIARARETLTQAKSAAENAAKTAKEAEERLSCALRAQGIAATEELRSRSMQEPERRSAEQRTQEFRCRQNLLTASVRELRSELEDAPVTVQAVQQMQEECEALKLREKENTFARAEWSAKRSKYSESRERYEALRREKKTVDRELGLVETLSRLCKGSELMNFAAEEYFREIAASASQRLQDLTDGRYLLVYRRTFAILDNLNGGAERDVKTLSGGETFLVSLCLAISLSEAIVNLSAKPLDFFFLDEGFGTLDQELFDTVISSLEKLKDTHFTIGLISHVPELRHRFPAKILVHSATQTQGSRVEVVTG